MIKKFNRGFTLIELLVVIAIIGVLSAVVLGQLNSARAKGANASIKSNLVNLRSPAGLWYDNISGGNGAFTGFCATPGTVSALASAASSGGGTINTSTNDCNDNAGGWAAYSVLKIAEGTFTTWCVDANGNSKGQTAAQATTLSNTATACL